MIDEAKLISLIEMARTRTQHNQGVINTSAELKQAVEEKEFVNELDLLQLLLMHLSDEEAVKSLFSEYCFNRDARNRGSLLHFAANPESKCNQLYFDIATALYPQATCLEICIHLLPNVTSILTVEMQLSKKSKKMRLKPHVAEKSVAEIVAEDTHTLNCPPTIHIFKQLLIMDNRIFHLKEIVEFNYDMHAKLYHSIKEIPVLKQALYAHNADLAKLYHTIELLQGKGGALGDFISATVELISDSGAFFGHLEQASMAGSTAAQTLVSYYNELPLPVQEALGACKNASGIHFCKVMGDIERAECIETVRRELQEILDNPVNKEVLDICPYLSKEEREELIRPYKDAFEEKQSIVNIDGRLNTTIYPDDLTRGFFREITIDYFDKFLACLVDFHPTQYAALLSESKIILENFDDCLQNIIPSLSQSQYITFLREMEKLPHKFDFWCLLMNCVIASAPDDGKSVGGIKMLLETILEDHAGWINDQYWGNNLFHNAAHNPEIIQLLLSYISPEAYQDTLKIKNFQGKNVLFLATKNQESFLLLFKLLPSDQRLAAITEKDSLGRSILEDVAKKIEFLQEIIQLLQENERLIAIEEAVWCLNSLECRALLSNQTMRSFISPERQDEYSRLITDRLRSLELPKTSRFFEVELSEAEEEFYSDLDNAGSGKNDSDSDDGEIRFWDIPLS